MPRSKFLKSIPATLLAGCYGRHLTLRRYRKLLEAIGVLIGLILCLILAWMGAQYAIDAYQTGNYTGSVVRIPMWPPRTLIVIGLLLMSVRLAVDFVNDMRVVVTNKESNPS